MNCELTNRIRDIDNAASEVEIMKTGKVQKLEIPEFVYLKVYGLLSKVYEQYCGVQKYFRSILNNVDQKEAMNKLNESVKHIDGVKIRSIHFVGQQIMLTIETNNSILGFSYRI